MAAALKSGQSAPLRLIDTHCHLDAPEFAPDVALVREQARRAGVACCVLVSVSPASFVRVRQLAHELGDVYALGIHPMYTAQAAPQDLHALQQALEEDRNDPRLVAIGEIGLDGFVPGLDMPRQQHFYRAQLRLAQQYGLPVLLHVRRAVDAVLHGLRDFAAAGGTATEPPWRGIAHAFNGSARQAQHFAQLGLKLGFGGAVTFERATRLRQLAATLPPSALVLETDSPDMPPQWLYRSAAQRSTGQGQARNTPAELPRIAAEIAALRGITPQELAMVCNANAMQALPRCAPFMHG